MVDRSEFAQVFEAAVATAVRAPSVHNTQPWRWRLVGDVIHLYADPSRQLHVTDPASRSLLMSCGAALHHMCVALAAYGWTTRVAYLPDSDDPHHLAAVTVSWGRPSRSDAELAAATAVRQSDRRHYSSRRVSGRHLRMVAATAPRFRTVARLVPVTLSEPLVRVTREATARHAADPGYTRELAAWSGRHGSPDGVPAANTPQPQSIGRIMQRAFAEPELADFESQSDASEWLVICTATDDRTARLRAGEASSAMLLTAASIGLASCLQTEPLGIPDLAAQIRTHVLQDCAFPQGMVRVGWTPANAAPLPVTPRRPIGDVIDAVVLN